MVINDVITGVFYAAAAYVLGLHLVGVAAYSTAPKRRLLADPDSSYHVVDERCALPLVFAGESAKPGGVRRVATCDWLSGIYPFRMQYLFHV